MARSKYLNGDDITLKGHNCDSCKPVKIQGVFCHESGCPETWRDTYKECALCGDDFLPESRHEVFCNNCFNNENDDDD